MSIYNLIINIRPVYIQRANLKFSVNTFCHVFGLKRENFTNYGNYVQAGVLF